MIIEAYSPHDFIWWEDEDHSYFVEWSWLFSGEYMIVGSYQENDEIGWSNEKLPNCWTWV